MGIVPAGLPASIEVTLDQPGLSVGFTLFDDSGVTPVQITGQAGQVNGVFPALNYLRNSYRAKLPGIGGVWYVLQKSVYLDNTYTAVDPNYPQGSDSLFFVPLPGVILPSSGLVTAQVDTSEIRTFVESNNILATVTDGN